MTTIFKNSLFVATLMVGCAGFASAGTIATASFSLNTLDAISYAGTSLDQATSITMGTILVGSPVGNFDCSNPANTGNCVNTGTDVAISPDPFVPGNLYTDFLVWGDDAGNTTRFHFTATAVSVDRKTPNVLNISMTGNFTDTLSPAFYSDNTASVLIGLTQAGGVGNAVSLSGTFATPEAFTLTPEPATMVLFGSALVGIGFLRRKKTAKVG